jgi:tetratricopeptide (TPR) repeat protein
VARKKKKKSKDHKHLSRAQPHWPTLACTIVLLAVGITAYINSFHGIFIFDDLDVPKNLSIRTLWPPWGALFDVANVSRPLIGLSLAINYAISGLDVWSYHLLNLSIHLAAGMTLFGIVRRTLINPRLADQFGRHATLPALAIALIWLVHPLQTQSVTYIIQRGESLMGLSNLLTLYCVIRGADSRRSGLWYAAAVASCACGMLSKQVMVTAPLVVLIYDFLFLSGSMRETLRKRAVLYGGLALTWGVLAATIIAAPSNLTAGFATQSISAWDYFKSEFGVIVHYIRLSVWPDSLCLDYDWPRAVSAGRVIPYLVVVVTLEAATVWALWKRKPAAFLGVWFFGILSVTSSFMPLTDLAFEHRMYLSLAAPIALVILGGYALLQRRLHSNTRPHEPDRRAAAILVVAVAVVVAALCLLTIRRNADYNDGITMWRDVATKRPDNARAYDNLAIFLAQKGRLDEASDAVRRAIELRPDYAEAHDTFGMLLVQRGNLNDAIAEFNRVIEINPTAYEAYTRLGAALANQQKFDEATAALSKALTIFPDYGPALANLGFAQERQGKTDDAINSLNEALRHLANSDLAASIHLSLGNLMAAQGQASDAAAHYREALKLKPDFVPAQQRLKQVSH